MQSFKPDPFDLRKSSSSIFPTLVPIYENVELLPAECFIHSGPLDWSDVLDFTDGPATWVAVKIALKVGGKVVQLTDARGRLVDNALIGLANAIQVDFSVHTEGDKTLICNEAEGQPPQTIPTPSGSLKVFGCYASWIKPFTLEEEPSTLTVEAPVAGAPEWKIKGAAEILCCKNKRVPRTFFSAEVRLQTAVLAKQFCGRCGEPRELDALVKQVCSAGFRKDALAAVSLDVNAESLSRMYLRLQLSGTGDPACNELANYPVQKRGDDTSLAAREFARWFWTWVLHTYDEPEEPKEFPSTALEPVLKQLEATLIDIIKYEAIQPCSIAADGQTLITYVTLRNRLCRGLRHLFENLPSERYEPTAKEGRTPEQLAKPSKRV